VTPSTVAILTRHLDGMVRAPRLPRLDRLRVWRDIAAVRVQIPSPARWVVRMEVA
jgi:hypothetical protein